MTRPARARSAAVAVTVALSLTSTVAGTAAAPPSRERPPGFGNTDLPDPSTWDYTFDHLAEVVDGLLTQVGFIAVEDNVRTVAGD
jgi:hypothetical protein